MWQLGLHLPFFSAIATQIILGIHANHIWVKFEGRGVGICCDLRFTNHSCGG